MSTLSQTAKSQTKRPLFEVKKDGATVMYTDNENCIPGADDLKAMKKLGYTFFRDGKRFTP